MLHTMICHDCPKLNYCYISADHCERCNKIAEMICRHMRKYHDAYKLEGLIYDTILDDDNTDQ